MRQNAQPARREPNFPARETSRQETDDSIRMISIVMCTDGNIHTDPSGVSAKQLGKTLDRPSPVHEHSSEGCLEVECVSLSDRKSDESDSSLAHRNLQELLKDRHIVDLSVRCAGCPLNPLRF
jgi:hypothetical protein